MKKLLLTIAFLFFAVIIGCSDDDDNNPVNGNTSKYTGVYTMEFSVFTNDMYVDSLGLNANVTEANGVLTGTADYRFKNVTDNVTTTQTITGGTVTGSVAGSEITFKVTGLVTTKTLEFEGTVTAEYDNVYEGVLVISDGNSEWTYQEKRLIISNE